MPRMLVRPNWADRCLIHLRLHLGPMAARNQVPGSFGVGLRAPGYGPCRAREL